MTRDDEVTRDGGAKTDGGATTGNTTDETGSARMSTTDETRTGRSYWRSQAYLQRDPELLERLEREFPHGIDGRDMEELQREISRRGFLGVMGASLALAGVTMTGCVRKPTELILPFAKRPEDLVPGKPMQYSTVARAGGAVLGLVVESQDGRPTKIEGNPSHPMTNPLGYASRDVRPTDGATNTYAQALVLELYDPDRSTTPREGGAETTWEALDAELARITATYRGRKGAGLAFLVEPTSSPTLRATYDALAARFSEARFFAWAPDEPRSRDAGYARVGAGGRHPVYELNHADVIVSLDADFLGVEGDTVRNARLFAESRRVLGGRDRMSRLHVAEPGFSVTGMQADHRLRTKSARVGAVLRAIASSLAGAGKGSLPRMVAPELATDEEAAFANRVVADLRAHEGRAVVVVGDRQPAWVHALALAVNEAIGAVGTTLRLVRGDERPFPRFAPIEALAEAVKAKEIEALFVVDTNPVATAPPELGLKDALPQLPTTVHVGYRHDETAALCRLHAPTSHFLEAWGDLRAADGTVAIQQPLIAPLHGTRTALETLARLLDLPALTDYEHVRLHWQRRAGAKGAAFEARWRRWLHDGVVDPQAAGAPPRHDAPTLQAAGVRAAIAEGEQAGSSDEDNGIEVDFVLDPSVYDGRYANSGWLQELPDPLTKLTWDNAALLSPKTAERLGVASEDVVRVSRGGASIEIVAHPTPGVADDVVLLPIGYGRDGAGRVARGAGFDVTPLRTMAALHFAGGATVEKTGATYALASTQDHGTMVEPHTGKLRPVVREATLAEYRADPDFVQRYEVMPAEKLKSLWEEPNTRTGQQWGLTIDLNACIGCNACTIACQAENNIPVVGKPRVAMGREMHWIRVDRYFTGSLDDPQAVAQPVPCMQCENAPCEGVCPVAATVHSPDGLNDMAYNRCIGTRYCSNNCPFKVRRFNFFNYQKENEAETPLVELQRNPDVTVRFRGVMEKCTYCVQRITAGKIDAKRSGLPAVPDGTIVPACAQACPTKAITFGDVNDPQSEVSQQKAEPRNYALLAELNIKPRTTYLARLRNPADEGDASGGS